MREIPIKLGPLALLLTVISICMTTLAILSFSTARADLSLAQTYAETVSARYELETQGQLFLSELSGALQTGGAEALALEQDEDHIFWKIIEAEDARLRIGFTVEDGSYRVVAWQQERDWKPDESIGKLWDGN